MHSCCLISPVEPSLSRDSYIYVPGRNLVMSEFTFALSSRTPPCLVRGLHILSLINISVCTVDGTYSVAMIWSGTVSHISPDKHVYAAGHQPDNLFRRTVLQKFEFHVLLYTVLPMPIYLCYYILYHARDTLFPVPKFAVSCFDFSSFQPLHSAILSLPLSGYHGFRFLVLHKSFQNHIPVMLITCPGTSRI